jgi:ATP-dependent Clp protease ATP-binding subunit ClpC
MTLIRFPLFWFVDAPLFLLRLFPRILDLVENRLAVGLHARMFFVPLFRDTSYVGRTLSFVFRISRIIAGIAAILTSLIFLALTFSVWLTLPFLVFIYGGWLGVISVGLFWLGFTLAIADRPHHEITGNDHLDTLERVATASVKRVLRHQGTTGELIISLLGFSHTQSILAKMGVEQEEFTNEVKKRAQRFTKPINTAELYQASLNHARKLNHPHVTLADLFLAILNSVPFVADTLFECGINPEEAQAVIKWMDRQWRLEHPPRFWHPEYQLKRLGGVNRAWTARPTPTLNHFSVDLTREAQLGKMSQIVSRGDIISNIIQILSRATRDNVLIIGPVGSGKTTLVTGLARSIIEGGVDPVLFSKRIVRLDVPQLIAGAEVQGEVEKRIIKIMAEVKEASNVIVFIDQIHTLAATGTGTESLNVFAALEPYLADPGVQVVGATSWLNYRRYIEPNEAFANSFQIVELPEADEMKTLQILETATLALEKKHKVTISFKALRAAYQLSERFIHDRVQPDKAVDILEEAASMAGQTQPYGSVTYEAIAKVIARRTEIPIEEVSVEESEKLLRLEEKLHQRVIGQDQAIGAIADALRRARVGLREENRPIATLLFAGPTGVGKTELTKALAEVYFGSEATMVRLDMSEYQTPDSIFSLLGPPPSSLGAPYPGRLT